MHSVVIVFILVYLFCCGYVAIRGMQALPKNRFLRVLWFMLVICFSVLWIITTVFVKKLPKEEITWLKVIGSAWIIAVAYGAMFAIMLDGLRMINRLFRIYPRFVREHYAGVKLSLFALIVLAIAASFTLGYFHFQEPSVRKLELTVPKSGGNMESVHIAVVSDLHLGYVLDRKYAERFVSGINALNADMILLVGDTIDREAAPLFEDNDQEVLRRLNAPLGVYAVLGNHEYLGNVGENIRLLRDSGIQVLIDESVKIKDSFYLVGRDDYMNPDRMELPYLLKKINPVLPIIIMDHQPRDLNTPEKNGVDLQLSGHTHNGQAWPMNWILYALYEVPYGYKQKGNMHVYVSSGLGLWGPPFRIGTDSEIIDLTIHFAPVEKE